MRTFVGLGLYAENSITLKGGNADVICAEYHTSSFGGNMVEEMDYFSATSKGLLVVGRSEACM